MSLIDLTKGVSGILPPDHGGGGGSSPTRVDVVSVSNIDLSNPGTDVFDGATVTSGMLVLAAAQSDPTENGVYEFDTDSTPLTRYSGWTTSGDFLGGKTAYVRNGDSYGDSTWTVRDTIVTLDTDPVVFAHTAFNFSKLPGDLLPWDTNVVNIGNGGLLIQDFYLNRGIRNSSGNIRIQMNTGDMFDDSNGPSLNFFSRDMFNSAGDSVINWSALTQGSAGQFLQTDGDGNVTWQFVTVPTLANNTYFPIRNAANTANLNAFKADSSDNFYFGEYGTGHVSFFQGSDVWFQGSGQFNLYSAINQFNIIGNGASTVVGFSDSTQGQYFKIRAANTMAGTFTMIWPATAPSLSGQPMQTDTSGNMSFGGAALQLFQSASDPAGTTAGLIYYNTIDNKIKFYNGSTWETVTST